MVVLFTVSLLSSTVAAQQAVVTPQWWVTQGPVVTPSQPLVTTPSVSLVTVSPDPVGASSATPGNVAGASSSTLATPPAAATGVRTRAVFAEPAGAVMVAAPAVAPPAENGVAVNGNGAPGAFSSGIGRFEGAGAPTAADGRSLGELARELAPHRSPVAGRVYTNDDIARLEEYVQARDTRFVAEEFQRVPPGVAAPTEPDMLTPEPGVRQRVEEGETRLDIRLEPEEPVTEPAAPEDAPSDPRMARLQPQQPQEPFPPAEPTAEPDQDMLPVTASPLPFMGLLALLAGAAGIAVWRLRS
jgi:hypothetical protein